MPVDEKGNRADVVMDPASTISRMNLGRLHEHYLSAAARDMSTEVKQRLGITTDKVTYEKIEVLDPSVLQSTYDFLLGFYAIISEKQFLFFRDQITQEEKLEHLRDVVNEGIYIYYPIENQADGLEIVRQIQRYHPPTYGPVSYVGNSGVRCMTKDPVMIAPLYMMLLEKIADDWSSVASGKLQHFGVLAPMTKSEKFSYPFRNAPIRAIGESEGRIFAGYTSRECISEMLDRSNSPMTQRNMIWNILDAPVPGNINEVVDRDYLPLGNSKPLALLKHFLQCSGFNIVYEPEDQQ